MTQIAALWILYIIMGSHKSIGEMNGIMTEDNTTMEKMKQGRG